MVILTALLLFQQPLKHQPQPTVPAITAGDLMTRLYIFADDSMAGREAGTLAHIKSTDYIAAELKRIGAAPGGDRGTYYQDFGLEVVGPDVTVTVDGEALTAGKDFIAFPFVGLPELGAPWNAENANVIFGGKVGSTRLVGPDAADGKIVLFLPADGPDGWQFWPKLPPPMYQRYARAKGLAVAALDVMPDDVKGYLGASQFQITGTGEIKQGTIPLLYISKATAEKMMGGPVTGILPGAEGKPVTAKGWFAAKPTAAPGRNVVAIVPGTDPVLKNQYVAFGAHTDHDGVEAPAVDHDSLRAFNAIVRPSGAEDAGKQARAAQKDSVAALWEKLKAEHPVRADSIMNGADDDATGSMALLELAEYFVKNPTRRSLLFVWHTAEEKGLFGSAWYSDHPTVPRDSIVTQINLDMIGRGEADDIRGGGPGYVQSIGSRRLSTELGELVESVNAQGNHGITFDYQYDANGHPQQFYCRSDHYNYARYGIPVVFFSTGSHRDYHMVTDEPQYINFTHFEKVVAYVADLGKTLADRDQRVTVDKPKPDPKGECKQ
jgi:hypothetical protein